MDASTLEAPPKQPENHDQKLRFGWLPHQFCRVGRCDLLIRLLHAVFHLILALRLALASHRQSRHAPTELKATWPMTKVTVFSMKASGRGNHQGNPTVEEDLQGLENL